MLYKNISSVSLLVPGLTNANSGENPGNEITVKTYVENGRVKPYISGQMMRYALRESIARTYPDYFKCQVDKPCCNPVDDIGCDTWGFMKAEKVERGETGKMADKRTSPVKVSPAIGLIGNEITHDFLVRYPRNGGGDPAPVDQNLSIDVYKWGVSIDIDHVSKGEGFEKATVKDLGDATRINRIVPIVEHLCDVTDVAKQTRLLCDLSPKLIVLALSKRYSGELQAALNVDKDMNVDTALLDSVLSDMKDISEFHAGFITGVFKNDDQINAVLKKHCATIGTPRITVNKVAQLIKNSN